MIEIVVSPAKLPYPLKKNNLKRSFGYYNGLKMEFSQSGEKNTVTSSSANRFYSYIEPTVKHGGGSIMVRCFMASKVPEPLYTLQEK